MEGCIAIKLDVKISTFKVKKVNIYEKHRENIEKIINEELIKLQNLNIWTGKIYLYRVSSEFDGEIQIKLSNL